MTALVVLLTGCGVGSEQDCDPAIEGGTAAQRREVDTAWDAFVEPLVLSLCVRRVELVPSIPVQGTEGHVVAGAWRQTPWGSHIEVADLPGVPLAGTVAHEACHALDGQHDLVRDGVVDVPYDPYADWADLRPEHVEAESFALWCALGPDALALAGADPALPNVDRDAVALLASEVWSAPALPPAGLAREPAGVWTPPGEGAEELASTADGRVAVRGEGDGGFWALDPATLAAEWSTDPWPGAPEVTTAAEEVPTELGWAALPGWVAGAAEPIDGTMLALAEVALPSGHAARAVLWGDPSAGVPARAGDAAEGDVLVATPDGRVWQAGLADGAVHVDQWR